MIPVADGAFQNDLLSIGGALGDLQPASGESSVLTTSILDKAFKGEL
jgi:hypothetical protein